MALSLYDRVMDVELFSTRRTGELVPIIEGGFGFIPRHLPVGPSVDDE